MLQNEHGHSVSAPSRIRNWMQIDYFDITWYCRAAIQIINILLHIVNQTEESWIRYLNSSAKVMSHD